MTQSTLFPFGNFRNLCIFLFVLTLIGISCKKDSDNKYHVTCKIDGVSMEFNGYTFAHTEESGGFTAVVVNGASSTKDDATAIGFIIINDIGSASLPIVAGDYHDVSTDFELLATYSEDVSGVDDYEAGTSVAEDASNQSVIIPNHFVVHLTELSSSVAKGQFSGDFYKNGDPSGTKKSITEGDFHVKFK